MILDPHLEFIYVLNQNTKENLKQIVTDKMISQTSSVSTKDTTSAPLRKTSLSELAPKKVYKTVWGKVFGEQQATETQSPA